MLETSTNGAGAAVEAAAAGREDRRAVGELGFGAGGMKAAINGGLNLSTLDGWWAEAYDGINGWALSGEVDPDSSAQDARDAANLFGLLEQNVLPAFYDRDADGLPRAWLARIRASIRTLAPGFCAGRMLDDYLERIYTTKTTSD